MFYVVRHGQRGDRGTPYERERIEIPFDPHLTEKGCAQAEETGIFLEEQIKAYEKLLSIRKGTDWTGRVKAVVISSPFLRTMMTAHNIVSRLSNVYENRIFIQDGFCEYLDKYFTHDVRRDLYIRTRTREETLKYFDYPVQDEIVPEGNLYNVVYPETMEECDRRVAYNMESLRESFSERFPQDEFVFIIVTHQFIVESVLRAYKNEVPLWSVEYCGIAHVAFEDIKDPNSFSVPIKGTDVHVKTMVQRGRKCQQIFHTQLMWLIRISFINKIGVELGFMDASSCCCQKILERNQAQFAFLAPF
eukprot:TRINITY_DN4229_c0_g1_i1.p1 TRINITY_DN4229_c0_g1~~TRINITY_DN4229_c0_g1_i1.p1  ORF type:complete len:304 (+),score=4.81 TRINITY_DN4229_c0_g1_i1:171-1082(+)